MTTLKDLTRRSLRYLASLAALGLLALSALTPTTTEAAAPQVKTQAPGFYRMMLGEFEIAVLSDGTAPRQVDKIMSQPDQVRRALTDDHEALLVEISINTFLINTGRLILVDTGAGELFGPHSGGRLVANLRAAGYRPDQIDAILLTHIHGDHSGGLSIGGQRVFPNALVYVDRHDPDLWLSKAAEDAAAPERKTTFRQSHATVDPYVSAGKLRPFDGAGDLFPGIRAIPAYGHTPGHTAYMVESQDQRLLLWGDIIHLTEVQFAHPDVSIEYDVDSTAAVTTRKRLLAGRQRRLPGRGRPHFLSRTWSCSCRRRGPRVASASLHRAPIDPL